MKSLTIGMSLLLLLSACAGGSGYSWQATENVSETQLAQVGKDCRWEAQKAHYSRPAFGHVPRNTAVGRYEANDYSGPMADPPHYFIKERAFKSCMLAKGWEEVEVN